MSPQGETPRDDELMMFLFLNEADDVCDSVDQEEYKQARKNMVGEMRLTTKILGATAANTMLRVLIRFNGY
jgi:hypothetical protein